MNGVLAVAFVLSWSSGFIGAKLGTGSADAVTLLMWRFVPAAVLLGIPVLWRRYRLSARALLAQAAIGLLSQGGYVLAVYYAIQLGVSSGTTALIDGTQPLVIAALLGPILGRRVSMWQWLGLATGLAGVAIVTGADAGASAGVPVWAYGIPFLGMLALVAATLLERRSPHAVDPVPALAIQCGVSAVAFSALAGLTGAVRPPADSTFWLAVGWLIAFSTIGGYGLYWLVLRRSGVERVNALMFLMAPTTAVWGAVMFGEPFRGQTAAGLLVCLVAVLVAFRRAPEVTCGPNLAHEH